MSSQLRLLLLLFQFLLLAICSARSGDAISNDDDDKSNTSFPSTLEMIRGRWSTVRQDFYDDDVTTILRMHAIDDYMTNEIYNDDYYQPVHGRCYMKHPLCAHLAASGECNNHAAKNFILNECAPACYRCHELSYETRCNYNPKSIEERDETNVLSKSGDLNIMFERIVNDTWFRQQYDIKIISSPSLSTGDADIDRPWMISFDTFLTSRECNELIDISETLGAGWERSWDAGKVREDTGMTERKISKLRTSKTNWCTKGCHNSILTQDIHQRIENITGIPQINYEHFQVLRYEKGDFYNIHHDYNPTQIDRPQGVRLLTFFLYLNDVQGGGGTKFPEIVDPDTGELGFISKPQAGKALLWPSVYDEDPNVKDPRMRHAALSVTEGMKYGANVWIHQRDFKTPESQECH